jgi:putative PIN family toxin of toxin-antitoxin system
MLVVIDTNVLISSYLSPASFPALVFQLLRAGRFKLVLTNAILEEYATVLRRSKLAPHLQLNEGQISDALDYFTKSSLIVEPTVSLRVVEADPKDDKFIECAVAGGADVIVSGDKHLLALGSYEGIQIVSPAVFVMLLERESPEE